MIGAWTNHLWQSTLFAVAAGLLTVTFRKNRAAVRYWLWLSASLKFLLPFSLLMSFGNHMQWAPAARKIATPPVSFTIVQIAQPFSGAVPLTPSAPADRAWVPVAILAVWACGFTAVALMRLRGWLRIRAAVSASTPMDISATVQVRSSPALLEPGVVGWLRPILLMPADILNRLTHAQLQAVLAHELSHVRRRDNLTSAIHMIVEAVFWFYPVVWWISAHLVEERERACDEEVLRLGSEPQVYAEGILNVCKSYLESPLSCVPGVTGSDLKNRIHEILTGCIACDLNFARKVALALAGIAALASPIFVGMINVPFLRAQPADTAAPKFIVASIKPCKDQPGNMRGSGESAPGQLSTGCDALVDARNSLGLIQRAYVRFANGQVNPFGIVPITGGPDWVHSNMYEIRATAEGKPSREIMQGPMLQALLEDRFHLKIRRETKQVPVYELTVAEGGSRLRRVKEGSCVSMPMTFPLPLLPAGQGYCRNLLGGMKGQNPLLHAESASLEEFSKLLSLLLDRPIIDKTGITGNFAFHLEFAIDQNTPRYLPGGDMAGDRPPAPDPAVPSIFAALRRLGLKLDTTNGPRDFLVIDHVERPTEN